MKKSWDIFCCVVDNFGDIGVTWRLARQLAAEYDLAVRLWVDDIKVFCRMCPEANEMLDAQMLEGVKVCHWKKPWPAAEMLDGVAVVADVVDVVDVVIEAFGCELPAQYLEQMAQQSTQPLWVNLEYLSAEAWVEGCHGLPSPQTCGLKKFFFFPGFTQSTGGLLRENNLLEMRRAFQSSGSSKKHFLAQIGVNPEPGCLLISLFAYPNQALTSWLQCLAAQEQPTHLLVPEGGLVADLAAWLAVSEQQLRLGVVKGGLTVQVIPFLSHQDYDRLLWSCDFNLVRGEDSFIRAQWAGRPFLWHIYPQQDEVHLDKLQAFMALYFPPKTDSTDDTMSQLWMAWNQQQRVEIIWPEVVKHYSLWGEQAEKWCETLSNQRNLAKSLVEFHQNWLKYAP